MDRQPPQQNHIPEQHKNTRSHDPAQPSHESSADEFAEVPLTAPLPTTERPRERSNSPVLQPSARMAPLPSSTALVTQRHSAPTQQCPSCGAVQPTSTSICMSCGTFLPAKSQRIRCRRCGTQASANLHLCPGCGRELQAAPPRSLSWLAPIILVLLFVLVIQQFAGLNALNWSRIQVATRWQWITEIGERLDPQITIKTVPVEVSTVAAEPIVENLADVNALAQLVREPLVAVNTDLTAEDGPKDLGGQSMNGQTGIFSATVASDNLAGADSTGADSTGADSTGEGATATVLKNAPSQLAIEPTSTSVPTAVPTAVPTERAIETPTIVIEPTAVSTATSSTAVAPSPTATAKKALTLEAVTITPADSASGEPLVQVNGTATRVEALVATNTPASTVRPVSTAASTAPTVTATSNTSNSGVAKAAQSEADQPVIASILQPTPTAQPSATAAPTATAVPATATATAAVTTYKVQAGDTPLAIAGRFDIGVDELFAANGLSAADARRLRVGQELIIPVLGQAVQPTATATSTVIAPTTAAANTAAANTATATTVPTAVPAPDSPIRLDAPQLRSPENGASLSCGGSNSLIWLPVSYMREGDRYLLHLGFLSGYNTDGSESIVWVLEQLQPANATIWSMDEGLCGLSPQNFGRQWRWYVEVVDPTDAAKTSVSLPSAIWGFSWN